MSLEAMVGGALRDMTGSSYKFHSGSIAATTSENTEISCGFRPKVVFCGMNYRYQYLYVLFDGANLILDSDDRGGILINDKPSLVSKITDNGFLLPYFSKEAGYFIHYLAIG